jgi:hypothetical protein
MIGPLSQMRSDGGGGIRGQGGGEGDGENYAEADPEKSKPRHGVSREEDGMVWVTSCSREGRGGDCWNRRFLSAFYI